MEFMELFIVQLVRKISKGTTLYVLADHGLTLCRSRHELPIVGYEPPVGREGRVLKTGEIPQFKGKLSPRCLNNYGDVAVIVENHACFKYLFEKERRKSLGVNGGLSREEIPINVWEYTK